MMSDAAATALSLIDLHFLLLYVPGCYVISCSILSPILASVLPDELTKPGHRIPRMASKRRLHMAKGTVKWFNATKGFGFSAPAGGARDVFVHVSALERGGIRQLDDGQAVTFDIESGRDGRESAINLALA